jgi:myo-inositol-1(or 4)-monophosphatase
MLKTRLAGDGAVFWGEESGREPVTAPGQLEWIIDPIDGTSNFAHGYPLFSISIAAVRDQQVVAGVVVEPITGDEYSADATGAYLNDEPLTARDVPEHVSQYNLITSFPAAEILHRAPESIELFGELVTTFATVRRLVSGALEICYAARGIADIVLGVDASPWDVAAASYILTQAGGTYLTGSDKPAHLAPHYLAVAPGRSTELVSKVFTQLRQM